MTCKALFSGGKRGKENYKYMESQHASLKTLEEQKILGDIKRPSAMKFLEQIDSSPDFEYDSDESYSAARQKIAMTFRANSPSPKRNRGSLLDLFQTNDQMTQTQKQLEGTE